METSFGPRTMKVLAVIASISTAGAAGLSSLKNYPDVNAIIKDICLMASSGLLGLLGYSIKVPGAAGAPKGDKP